MAGKVILTVTDGELSGQGFVFDERNTCIIGRGKDCQVKLPNNEHHKTISRYHCLLDINPPDIRVRDFGSLNGTFVNGRRIGKREKGQTAKQAAQETFVEHDLKDGDKIKLGKTVFQVHIEMPAPAEVQPTGPADNAPPAGADPQEILKMLLGLAKTGEHDLLAIQGYEIVRELGRGGMGAVYLARHEQSGQEVALKVMLPKVAIEDRAKNMFLREMEICKSLRHRNVVQMSDCGCSQGTFFLTLEFCDGGSLDRLYSKDKPLGVDEAVNIALQILAGLEHAHSAEVAQVRLKDGTQAQGKGVVHRDLKPQNIFIKGSGISQVIKLADFGLAKAFDTAGLSGQTRTGTAAGTPVFMPRQQVINFKYAKPEVDVWATAATLYHMLTGCYPRDFKKGADLWQTVLQTNAVPICVRNSMIPPRLAEVIDEALVDKPRIGFSTAAGFRRALEQAL